MRGSDHVQEAPFGFTRLEDFVPTDHPLRKVRDIVNESSMRPNGLFDAIYADRDRVSVAPQKPIRALLLQILYSVRSERQLMEQLRDNLFFRWFVGLAIDDEVWNRSVFSKTRDRLLEHEIVEAFFTEAMTVAECARLLGREPFSVDGTPIQAWASHKRFRPRDGSDEPSAGGTGRNTQADFEGKRRCNDTHASTTDPEARLYRKGKGRPAILAYQGHVLMENRSGLVVSAVVTHADGFGERAAAQTMFDKASQVIRKRIEEHFGWGKTVGRIRQTVYRGLRRADRHFKLAMTASNLMRIARMLGAAQQGAAQ